MLLHLYMWRKGVMSGNCSNKCGQTTYIVARLSNDEQDYKRTLFLHTLGQGELIVYNGMQLEENQTGWRSQCLRQPLHRQDQWNVWKICVQQEGPENWWISRRLHCCPSYSCFHMQLLWLSERFSAERPHRLGNKRQLYRKTIATRGRP